MSNSTNTFSEKITTVLANSWGRYREFASAARKKKSLLTECSVSLTS